MSLEIRPITEAELKQFMKVASTALIRNSSEFAAMRPEFTLCGFEDGNMTATYASWPLTMRFNGQGTPVAGVTCVGTLPIYRRRGYLKQIIAEHFEYLHESGGPAIAILNASWAAIYQRYGYAVVSTRRLYNVEPRFLDFSFNRPGPTGGVLRELSDDPDHFSLLVDLYRKFRAERTGYVHRGRAMWSAGALAPSPDNDRLYQLVYEENGEPLGYVIYTVQMKTPTMTGHRIVIRDLIWLSQAAYRVFWKHFALMDIVEHIIWERVPMDDPLPHLLLEPRMLNPVERDGLLARIVDVEHALTQRHYGCDATLTFDVVDDFCPWNQGCFKLETSNNESAAFSTNESPQLIIPVSTLAMLLFGQIRPSEAARMGRLTVCDENALSVWDRVMDTMYRPHCADFF